MDLLRLTILALGGGFLLAMPGIIIGYCLQKKRKLANRAGFSLFFCIVLVLIREIWLPNLSFSWLALISIAGSTLGVYRMDIYWMFRQTSTLSSDDAKE
jgi:hypothetical protein